MAVRYTLDLLARVEAYLATPLRERRLAQASRDELLALYNAITGERRNWCPSCEYSDFFSVIVAYQREATHFLHPETVSDTKYTFAPGYESETFSHENYNEAVTAENLTDQSAEFFIKHGFGHAIVLKPGQQPDAAGSEAGEADEKPSKTDLQARYKELYGADAPKKHGVAKLTADIEAKEGEIALTNARASYADAFGDEPDHRLGVAKLTELTEAKRAEGTTGTDAETGTANGVE